MDASTAAAELEEDLRIRLGELSFLENVCGALAEPDQDRMRRSILLMLYAHFEGFSKTAFEVYRRHINEAKLTCKEVQPELATSALKDVFRAFRHPDTAQNFLPPELQGIGELKPLAIERTLIEKAWTFAEREVEIHDKYIDMESNLKPVVFRKNLYRLGLPYSMFDVHESIVNQLLRRRNNIAHGAEALGVDLGVYTPMKEAVLEVMNDLRVKVIEAITTKAYLRNTVEAPV